MKTPFTAREWVVMALYEAHHYVFRVSEASLNEEVDYADYELLEILERAINELGNAFDKSRPRLCES